MNSAVEASMFVVGTVLAIFVKLLKLLAVVYIGYAGIIWFVSSVYYAKIADMTAIGQPIVISVIAWLLGYIIDGLTDDVGKHIDPPQAE